MIVAECVFKNAKGFSQPYHYAISEKIAEKLEPNTYVVVSSARTKYGIAIFKGIAEVTDPQQIKIITQHVVCEIKDQYQEEKND